MVHIGTGTALVNDGNGSAQTVGELSGTGNRTQVRRYYNQILPGEVLELFHEVGSQQRNALQMIHRNIEEALDLCGMEIHGEHTVSTSGSDQVCYQLGRDRVTALGLAVLTGIAVIGDNCCDASGGSTLESIDHNEQLHQVIVDRAAGGLDYKYIGTAYRLVDGNRDLTIREGLDFRVAQRQAQMPCDLLGNMRNGVGCENFDVLAV